MENCLTAMYFSCTMLSSIGLLLEELKGQNSCGNCLQRTELFVQMENSLFGSPIFVGNKRRGLGCRTMTSFSCFGYAFLLGN